MSKNNDNGCMTGSKRKFTPPVSVLAAGLLAALPFLARAQMDGASAPTAVPAAAITTSRPLPAKPSPMLPAPDWAGLTPAQKEALAPLERDWNGLDDARKSKWLEIAPRFAALPQQERERIHERMRAWAALSPVERQQARVGYQMIQQLKTQDREAKWEAYQALSPERRHELAEKAAQKQVAKKPCLSGVGGKRCTETSLEATPKSNLVPPPPKVEPAKPVAPSVVQAKPGVSTVLITQATMPPAHQQAGQTKVWADPELVDSKTLLPKKPSPAQSR